ncbi:class II fructose-bisphosphate aldolase [Candidatus Woesearchaeota archaeon]|nr:class II fructose-bisphosphate aldolase [Candidatus Woesearchaeota archaeon]
MLANTKTLLIKAQRAGYAVPHFNINNMEMLQGVVQAAVNLKSPIILATSQGGIDYAGMRFLHGLATTAAQISDIPIALHLDHGKDLDTIKHAIEIGYSSVMIDASHEEFEKNVAITRKVVQMAHAKGITVEAELGTIGGVEDTVSSRNIIYTDPAKAAEFVQRTGCDFLAVAIGTSHGAYKFSGKASLRIDILQQIQQRVHIPLVLHGASGVPRTLVKMAEKYGAQLHGVEGVPDSQIQKAVKKGICKINTDTDLRIAFDAAVRKVIMEQPKDFDPRHILGPARDLMMDVAMQRIRLFGSAGKA